MKNEWMKIGRDNGILVQSQAQPSMVFQSLEGIDRRGREEGALPAGVSSASGKLLEGAWPAEARRSERPGGAKMAAVMAAPEPAEAPSSLLLLVVGGECGCPGLLAYVLEELERGRAHWDLGRRRRGGASRAGGSGARRAGVRVGLGGPRTQRSECGLRSRRAYGCARA